MARAAARFGFWWPRPHSRSPGPRGADRPGLVHLSWTPIQYPSAAARRPDDQRRASRRRTSSATRRIRPSITASTTTARRPPRMATSPSRVRIGATEPGGFDTHGVAWTANNDGAARTLARSRTRHRTDRLLNDAGSGANVSPSTTTIVSTALFSYALSGEHYHFLAVRTSRSIPAPPARTSTRTATRTTS